VIDVIAIAAVALAGLGGITVALLKLSTANDKRQVAVDALAIANRTQIAAERERDQAVAARVQVTAERDAALVQLTATQKLANAAGEEFATRVKARLDSGSAADASVVLDELLAAPLPGVAVAPAVVAAGGHGDAGATAVPAAVAAAAGDAGRRP
jgi:hypothetical protein